MDYLLGTIAIIVITACLIAVVAIPMKVYFRYHLPAPTRSEFRDMKDELSKAKTCIEAIDRLAYDSRGHESNLAYSIIETVSEWRRNYPIQIPRRRDR